MHANALQPRRRCLMLAALTLGTIFAATLTARAAAPRSTLPPIFAFSDARSLPTTATLLARLPGTRARLCPAGTPAPLTPLTLAQALDDVTAALVRTHGRAALTALAHGPLGHGAGTAEHAMAGAIIAGSPDAALVAALLAHQQAPDDPRPLVDMAALLPDRGMARQALALLDAADLMRYPTDAPLGISLSAVSANNRGYALLALHRWQQAEAPLTHAARLAPHLSEAGLNLGEAYLCAGDDLHAARAFLSGGRRDSFRPDQVEGAGDPPITEQVRPDQIFDLSAGIARRLPDLTYPLTPQQAVALEPTYQHIITVEENARTAAVNAAMIRAIQHLPSVNPATFQRGYDIIRAILTANEAPGLRDLYARQSALQLATENIGTHFWTDLVMNHARQSRNDPWCVPATRAMHQRWFQSMLAFDAATRAYWQAYSRYATGLAANLADPTFHAYAEALIAQIGVAEYYVGLLGNGVWEPVMSWEYKLQRSCVGEAGAPGEQMAPQQLSEDPPAPACPPGIAAPHNLVLTLPAPFDYLNLKANCESISVQVESPEPGVKGFIAGSRDWRTGETTVVVGPKVGGSIPGTGISAGIETGIYVTTGKSGVTDWGVSINLTGTPASTPSGLASFEANAPVTISLAGSIDYLPTALGLGN